MQWELRIVMGIGRKGVSDIGGLREEKVVLLRYT